MKTETFVIELRVPVALRRAVGYGLPALAILITGVVLASPKQWASGEPLTASDLNALTVITKGTTQYSVGATHYCGIGPVATNGDFAYNGTTGYAAAKAMCAASTECGMSPSAHMCDASEIVRSKALGDQLEHGWYSGGLSYTDDSFGTTVKVRDCGDWTSSDSSSYAPALGGLTGAAALSISNCGASNQVLCCD
jgi:hypothetical protein